MLMKPRFKILVGIVALFLAIAAIGGWTAAQGDKVDAKKLKSMIEQLGFEIKVLEEKEGSEMYEFKVREDDTDVFVAAEISPSKNYVWLTVFFGKMTELKGTAEELLRENALIQPSQFYVTKDGNLKMALAIDNRGITNPILKAKIESVAVNVVDTIDLWAKKK